MMRSSVILPVNTVIIRKKEVLFQTILENIFRAVGCLPSQPWNRAKKWTLQTFCLKKMDKLLRVVNASLLIRFLKMYNLPLDIEDQTFGTWFKGV